MDRILRSQRSGAEQEGLTQIQKWVNPNSKMARPKFKNGSYEFFTRRGFGETHFSQKNQSIPRGMSHGENVRIPYPAPSL